MAPKTDRAHIIAVDDERVICRSISAILRREGFKVTTVDQGREALELISSDPNSFNLLITDILMPDFSGIKLVEGLREREIPLPVLAMTGYADETQLGKMRNLGCEHILIKPFDQESLSQMVQMALLGDRAGLSLAELIEASAQRFVMADLESQDDFMELRGYLAQIQAKLCRDDAANEVSVLSTPEVLDACRKGAAEASDALSGAFADGGGNGSIDRLGRTLATMQAVICQGRASDYIHFPSSHNGNADDDDLHVLFATQQDEWLVAVRSELAEAGDSLDQKGVETVRSLFHRHAGDAGAIGYTVMDQVCRAIMALLDEYGSSVCPDDLSQVLEWFESAEPQCRKGDTVLPPQEPIDRLITRATNSPSVPSVADADDAQVVPIHVETAPSRADVINCDVSLDPILIEDLDLGTAFVVEAREYFEASDENLLILEREPDNEEALAVVMRTVHTLKGICGFLDIQPIEALSHAIEELLETVAAGEEQFTGELNDLVFHSLDLLKELVSDVDQALTGDHTFHPRSEIHPALKNIAQFLQVGSTAATPTPSPTTTPEPEVGESPEVETITKTSTPRSNQGATRVDSSKIDLLLDTIGELVIAESIVEKDPEIQKLGSVRTARNIAHLGKITRQLQDLGLAMRMVPIRSTFRKMERLVRDLTRKSDKKVEFITEGEETQIDREMVDKLIEPLVHLLRNAVDHGIESDLESRQAQGKPEMGTIRLSANHTGGSIHIRIQDDGGGLNRDAISAKAIERGVIQSADGLSDSEVFALIFEAGLSTAAKLTSVSGRGVGMDVVRSQIESLHGKVQVDSVRGKGTTFTLVLPLTTAIIDGMIIGVGSQQYILPVLSIVESFRPTEEQVSLIVGRGEIIRFRGKMLPLFRLSALFDIQDASTELSDTIAIVVDDSGQQTALLVDDLIGQQQTVIKNLGGALPDTTGVSGVSIMADGTPGLILDVAGIVRLAIEGGK